MFVHGIQALFLSFCLTMAACDAQIRSTDTGSTETQSADVGPPVVSTAAISTDNLSKSSDAQAAQPKWEEAQHDLIGSLAELRRTQQSLGLHSFQVDLKAQLTFAARYWTVFYVQDEGIPAMIRCTDAATAILSAQSVGTWLRIRGLVYEGQLEIHLVSMDVLPPAAAPAAQASLKPLPITSLQKQGVAERDAFVELECELHELLDQRNFSTIAASVGLQRVELHLQSTLSDDQALAIAQHPTAIVRGTLSPKKLESVDDNFSIRMMGSDQLQPKTGSTIKGGQSIATSSTPNVQIEGPVLFSDGQSEILMGTQQGVQRVITQFAPILLPGFEINVWGKQQVASSTKAQSILAVCTRQLQEKTLTPATEVRFSDLLKQSQLPIRVMLEAQVAGQQSAGVLRYYTLTDGARRFTAVVNESNAAPRLKYRTGDRIRLIGSPLREAVTTTGNSSSVTLYVVGPDDVEFISAPYQLSLTHVALGSSIAAFLVTLFFVWNWMLRKQVSLRTKRLNQISSHLRMSFEAVSEAVLIHNATGEVAACNRQFARLFGEMPQEGQPVAGILNNLRGLLSDCSPLDSLQSALSRSTAEPVTATLQLENPARTVRSFLSAIIDCDGTYHGHLWTFSDITDKLRLENELIQAQKMEAVGQLSGGIAHDFNNLLTVLRSNLTLLKRSDANEMQQECMHAAETAVGRAAELTQQLLDFSRRSHLDFQVVDLCVLIKRVSLLLRSSFDLTIDLRTNLSTEPLFARVDINRLEQVLINICINARDALKGRDGEIVLSVRSGSAGASGDKEAHDSRQWAVIEIRDNGCGMSHETQRRIFEPFFTTKKPGEGTGLGLSMAHGLIQQFGGTIHCQSTPDVGSTFRIVLPTTDPIMEPTPPASPGMPATRSSLRVLLVDDEVLIRRSGQAILKALGHVPQVAANGREAIELLETEQFDAVLLDLTMPVMSGKEAFFEIRSRWPALPVAISTGYFIDPHSWHGQHDGQPPYMLQKPYAVSDLAAFLQG